MVGIRALGWFGTFLTALMITNLSQAQDVPQSLPDRSTLLVPDVTAGEPEPSSHSGIFFSAEYLLVQPIRGGLDIGILSANQNSVLNGVVESLRWNPSSGIRIGAGYRVPDTDWDVGVYGTYFHDPFNRQVYAPNGGSLQPSLIQRPGVENVGMADGDVDLGYKVIDLEVGKSIWGDAYQFRVFGGGRFAEIDQAFKCIYTGGDLGSLSDYINRPVKFDGGGFSLGAEGNWKIFGNWGVYGRARGSLLAGQFNTQFSEILGGMQTINLTDKSFAIVPEIELGIGLSYQGDHFFGSVGYDFVDWFNLIDGLSYPGTGIQTSVHKSDLGLGIFSVKFGVRF